MSPEAKRYHHGHLAEALVDAGFALAAEGGRAAVTVREAARRVGVSAPAAYRHFADRDRFVVVIARRCREALAQAMIDARDTKRVPRRRFEAVGRAYIDFAIANPGLMDCAFGADADLQPDQPDAFAVLVECLDELTAANLLDPSRREGAEMVAWASVHGIAVLLAKTPGGVSPHDHAVTADIAARQVLRGVEHALGVE